MKEREFFVSLCLYADKNLSHGQQVPANAVNGLIFLIYFSLLFSFSASLETSPNLMHFSHVAGKLKKKIITISK